MTVEEKNELKQEKMPEAVASVSYSLITPLGYPIIFTMRGLSETELLQRMSKTENYLKVQEFLPDIKRPIQPKLPLPVTGEKCPLCGSPVVEVTYKKDGETKKLQKCSTQKFDFATKKQTGCSYTKFLD